MGGAIRHRVFIPVVIPQLHLVGVTTLWQFAVSFAYPIIWHTAIPDPQQPMRRCTVTRARVHICASACTVLVRVHRTLVCASACVHAYARVCTGTRTQVHIHRHRQTDTHTHTHTYTRWDTHTHTPTSIHGARNRLPTQPFGSKPAVRPPPLGSYYYYYYILVISCYYYYYYYHYHYCYYYYYYMY